MPTDDNRWLVYDRRQEIGDRPGTHALAIGVSVYRHLAEGDNSPPALELRQLSFGARSAYIFHNWMRNNAHRLAFPLKTLRLLVAPSLSEAPEIENLDRCRSDVSFEDFVSALYLWREDASHNPDDATIFYFCGNGFDLGASDPVIALGNFGAPRRPVLGDTVAVNHLIRGFAPSDLLPRIARTQLYFIDSSRMRMSFTYEWMNAPSVFDLGRPWLDDRQLALCHASSPGQQAFAVLGGTSFFLAGLLRCLQGEAAVLDQKPDPSQATPVWQVTLGSLMQALPTTVQRLTKKELPNEQRVFVNASTAHEVVLFRLDSAPLVPVTVDFEPSDAAERAVFDIRQGDGSSIDILEGSRTSGRRELIIPAGLYLVRISFLPTTAGLPEKEVYFFSTLTPPQAVWSIRASP